MTKTFRTLSFIVFVFAFLLPGTSMGASVYSMLLMGERIESGDVRAITLGGSQHLMVDSLGAGSLNPALLARIPRMTIAATQYLATDEGRSQDYTEQDISFTFSSFRMVVPVGRWLRFGVGYTGRYDPDGGFTVFSSTDGGDAYRTTYTTSGGLYSIPLMVAFDLTRFVSIGLTYSFESGTVEQRWDIVFDDPDFAPASGIKKENVRGRGFGGGLVLHPFQGLMIGGMYESSIDYDSEARDRYQQTALDTSYSGSVFLPPRVNAGVTWQIRRSLTVLASAAFSDFKDFRGFAFPQDRLKTERSYSVGLEYIRGAGENKHGIPIRLGFNYQQLPFGHPNEELVNKVTFGLGSGIYIKGGKGKVDLGLVVGRVGSIDKNGIEDRLIRLYVGVSGSELWKRKGVRRY
jgi:hypothetical protein